MPTRWWLPLATLNPRHVAPQQTHGALASWLDPVIAAERGTDPDWEHAQAIKPWFASPVSRAEDGSFGIEVSALTDFVSELVAAGPPNEYLRLGRSTVATGTPSFITGADWEDLAKPSRHRSWTIVALTPTCFRLRGAAAVSPLPSVEAILRGLDNYWVAFSGRDSRLPNHEAPAVSVVHVDIETHLITISRKNNPRSPSTVPGFVGEVTFEATAKSAAQVSPLFELVNYVSIGSFARRGLGVARLLSTSEGIQNDHLDRQPHTA